MKTDYLVGKDDQTKIFEIVPSQEALLIFNIFVAIMNCHDNLRFLSDDVCGYFFLHKERTSLQILNGEKTEIKYIHTFTQLRQHQLAVAWRDVS